ncbi:UNVERIFIED_CONTAM: protein virilizer [Sesamum radiatum]|uniref:Protein virilizer n=1 Tax=Sesamum radiatum TaxID=300843 RepID=A0AAW2R471_SESRA
MKLRLGFLVLADYLVDEGAEGNSTSDLLLERNREKSLFDLLIPSLVLLINLLQKLQEAKEQHRNTKLMSALLQLHREVSPKLASCAAELSHTCPDFVLGFGAVCHLLASALACWPVYSWTPGLFHFLLDSLHATSLLALGPKETCSLLCLLNGIPLLSPLRAVAVGTLLGPEKEKQINWYLKPGNPVKLLAQLSQQLAKLGEVILHCAVSMSVVIQDILRVFVVRIACLNLDYASVLVRPIISWISHRLLEPSMLSDVDAYKVHQLLKFLAILLEHPIAKPLFLREGGCQMLTKVLERCTGAANSDLKQFPENINLAKYESSLISWSTPVFRSISLISDDSAFFQHPGVQYRKIYFLWLPGIFLTVLQPKNVPYSGHISLDFAWMDLSATVEKPKSFGNLRLARDLVNLITCLMNTSNILSPLDKVIEMKTDPLRSMIVVIKKMLLKDIGNAFSVMAKHVGSCSIRVLVPSFLFENVPFLCSVNVALHRRERLLLNWSLGVTVIFISLVLPVGRELLACLAAFKEMGSSTEGQSALLSFVKHIQSSTIQDSESQMNHESDASYGKVHASEWKEHPPLLCCWTSLLRSIDSKNVPPVQVAVAIHTLTSGALGICMDRESVNLERVAVIKFLFGVKNDYPSEGFVEDDLKYIEELANMLGSVTCNELEPDALPTPDQIKETANLLLRLLQKLAQTGLSAKRKISSLEGTNRHTRGDNSVVEATSQNTFSRGSVPVTTPPGPTRRDTFRQRKPNTSRPPSMHVDDYVARERNVDGNSSNVIAVQRIGSSSGRPPSIHVDVFMARQRERQGLAVNDVVTQVKTAAPDDNIDAEKSIKPRQLKTDLDDDLQGIDIVFDAEESEPDDKLPFPQPDDNLQQPASVVIEQRSPHSIVEETESDVNDSSQFSRLGTPLASNMDENTPSEYSSRMSASRPEMPLTREPSISSDKKFSDQAEDTKSLPTRIPNAIDSSAIPSSSGVAASIYMNTSSSSVRFSVDSRIPPNLYSNASVQQSGTVPLGTGLQGFYDQKFPPNQPPLPPMPPPPTVSPVLSQNMDPVVSQSSSFVKSVADVQAQVPPGFHVQSDYASVVPGSSTSLATSIALPDTKFGRTSIPSPLGSTRPPPPLPPTPPPYSASSSLKNSTSLSPQYFQTVSNSELQQTSAAPPVDGMVNLSASRTMITSYPPPPLMQPLLFRPSSMPVGLYGNSLVPHHGENLANVSQNLPMSLPSVQAIPALTQLQPLQPPQIPRPPPQHLRPPVPASPHSEQGATLLQSSLQIPAQPSQVLQQPQVSPAHVYYQIQQQENVSQSLQQQQVDRSQRSLQPSGDGTSSNKILECLYKSILDLLKRYSLF